MNYIVQQLIVDNNFIIARPFRLNYHRYIPIIININTIVNFITLDISKTKKNTLL